MPAVRLTTERCPKQFLFWLSLLRSKFPDFPCNAITQNINQKYEPHTHQRQSRSKIILFGDFTGGALCLEDGTRFSEKNVFFEFDGSMKHWVQPWEGDRISLVFYYKKPQGEYSSAKANGTD